MLKGYYPEEPDSIDNALDELLCEYVDGTMDPTVQSVFEEYLETNPDLAAHVRCLCETRNMLCRIGACRCASLTLQAQLRVRLSNELARKNHSSAVLWSRLGKVAFVTSAASLLLLVGMMAGISIFQRTFVAGSQEAIADVDYPVAGMEIPNDAHGFFGKSQRLEMLPGSVRSGIVGPVSALPVVAGTGYMTPISWPVPVTDPFILLARMGIREVSP